MARCAWHGAARRAEGAPGGGRHARSRRRHAARRGDGGDDRIPLRVRPALVRRDASDFERDAFWIAARSTILSSFLLLVGVSLVLAARAGTPFPAFARRVAVIAACALAVSMASYYAFPRTWIHFGVLHCIAVASLGAWPLRRRPRTRARARHRGRRARARRFASGLRHPGPVVDRVHHLQAADRGLRPARAMGGPRVRRHRAWPRAGEARVLPARPAHPVARGAALARPAQPRGVHAPPAAAPGLAVAGPALGDEFGRHSLRPGAPPRTMRRMNIDRAVARVCASARWLVLPLALLLFLQWPLRDLRAARTRARPTTSRNACSRSTSPSRSPPRRARARISPPMRSRAAIRQRCAAAARARRRGCVVRAAVGAVRALARWPDRGRRSASSRRFPTPTIRATSWSSVAVVLLALLVLCRRSLDLRAGRTRAGARSMESAALWMLPRSRWR